MYIIESPHIFMRGWLGALRVGVLASHTFFLLNSDRHSVKWCRDCEMNLEKS